MLVVFYISIGRWLSHTRKKNNSTSWSELLLFCCLPICKNLTRLIIFSWKQPDKGFWYFQGVWPPSLPSLQGSLCTSSHTLTGDCTMLISRNKNNIKIYSIFVFYKRPLKKDCNFFKMLFTFRIFLTDNISQTDYVNVHQSSVVKSKSIVLFSDKSEQWPLSMSN